MNNGLHHKIREKLLTGSYRTEATRENGNTIQGLKCPKCGKNEAWAYSEEPNSINCNRADKCGVKTPTRELFPELWDFEKEFPVTAEDPERPATEYLKSRGLYQVLPGLKYRYEKNIRSTGAGGVLFCVDGNCWNGRLFNPPQGEGKTHNTGSTGGKVWKHQGVEIDWEKPLYVTEGIINALSLMEMGLQAVAVLSSGQDPEKLKDFFQEQAVILAFDNDEAGKKAFLKWKKIFRKAECIAPPEGKDWNDLLLSGLRQKQDFEKSGKEFKHYAALLTAKTAKKYAEQEFNYSQRPPAFFEFEKAYYTATIEKGRTPEPPEIRVQKVSDAIIEPVYREVEEGAGPEVVKKTFVRISPESGSSKKSINTILSSEDMSTEPKMNMFFSKAGFWWGGNKVSVSMLRQKVMGAVIPEVRPLPYQGYDKKTGFYVFQHFAISPNGCLMRATDKGFPVEKDSFIKTSQISDINLSPEEGEPAGRILDQISKAWGERGLVALSWAFASWFSHEVRLKTNFFPFLSLYGEPQTGKSELTRILSLLQGIDEEGLSMTGASSQNGASRKLTQKSSLFQAILEGNRTNKRNEKKCLEMDHLLTLYNAGCALHIKAAFTNDNKTREAAFLGALMFTQNKEPFETKSQKERAVSIRFRGKEYGEITEETTEALRGLKKIPPNKMAWFFVEVMKNRGLVSEKWYSEYEKARNELMERVNNARLAETHAVILSFSRVLFELLNQKYDLKDFLCGLSDLKQDDILMSDEYEEATEFLRHVLELQEESREEFAIIQSKPDEPEKLCLLFKDAYEAIKKKYINSYKNGKSLQNLLKTHPARVEGAPKKQRFAASYPKPCLTFLVDKIK